MLRNSLFLNHVRRRLPVANCSPWLSNNLLTASSSSSSSSSSCRWICVRHHTDRSPRSFEEFFDCPSDVENETIRARIDTEPGKNPKLGRNALDLFFTTVTNIIKDSATNNKNPLAVGNVFRNTPVQPYGMRSRAEVFAKIEDEVLGSFFSDTATTNEQKTNDSDNSENNKTTSSKIPAITTNSNIETSSDQIPPIILIISMNRQGKTLLLDTIANDDRFHNKIAKAFGSTGKCSLVFNITFNGNFDIEERGTSRFTYEDAVLELTLRLAAAVVKVHTHSNSLIGPLRATLQCFQRAELLFVNKFVQSLRHAVAVGLGKRQEDFVWFFLMDEITKLTNLLSEDTPIDANGEKNPKAKSPRQQFFSSVAHLISSQGLRCIVVASGFTHYVDPLTKNKPKRQRDLTGSDRPQIYIDLSPINRSRTRRNALVLKTQYYSIVGRLSDGKSNDLADALFNYELMKSSLGIFGHVIQRLLHRGIIATEPYNSTTARSSIPIIQIIGGDEGLLDWMLRVMEWKSVQFLTQFPFAAPAGLGMLETCLGAQQFKVAHLRSPTIQWYDPDVTSEDSTALSTVLVEPLFLSESLARHLMRVANPTPGGHYLHTYTKMLRKFCRALCGVFEPTPRLVSTHFTLFIANEDAVEEEEEGVAEKKDAIKEKERNKKIKALPGHFFESAIAHGICTQKSLRADLIKRLSDGTPNGAVNNQTAPLACNLRNMLEGATPVVPVESEPDIDWRQDEDPEILNFEGHFPLSNGEPVVVSNPFTFPDQQVSPATIQFHFNTSTVLCALPPTSKNPLVDVIFHEKLHQHQSTTTTTTATTATVINTISHQHQQQQQQEQQQQQPSSLVQFWIDAKHRHSRQDTLNNMRTFAPSVAKSLANPLLRNSSIKHVVHIIITPSQFAKKQRLEVRSKVENAVQKIRQATRANLPTYSLYLVSPESIAFENFVSHYIARTIPLMDQQLRDSWCQRLDDSTEKWKTYQATTRTGLDYLFGDSPSGDHSLSFQEWREMRANDVCVSPIWSVFEKLRDDIAKQEKRTSPHLSPRELTERVSEKFRHSLTNNNSNEQFVSELLSTSSLRYNLRFGTIFERCGITRPTDPVDPKLSFAAPFRESDIDSMLSIIKSNSDLYSTFATNHVHIGMLIDSKKDSSNDVWKPLFNYEFVQAWNNNASYCVEKGFVDEEWCSKQKPSNQTFIGIASAAAAVWEMSPNAWTTNRNRYNNKNINLFKKCLRKPPPKNEEEEEILRAMKYPEKYSQLYFLFRQLEGSSSTPVEVKAAVATFLKEIENVVSKFKKGEFNL